MAVLVWQQHMFRKQCPTFFDADGGPITGYKKRPNFLVTTFGRALLLQAAAWQQLFQSVWLHVFSHVFSCVLSGWLFEPHWKIWTSIGMIIPNIWENKKWQPNHQPVIFSQILCFIWFSTGFFHWNMIFFQWPPTLKTLFWHCFRHTAWTCAWQSHFDFPSGILSGFLMWHIVTNFIKPSIWHLFSYVAWHNFLFFPGIFWCFF